jgi:hypothetical protein
MTAFRVPNYATSFTLRESHLQVLYIPPRNFVFNIIKFSYSPQWKKRKLASSTDTVTKPEKVSQKVTGKDVSVHAKKAYGERRQAPLIRNLDASCPTVRFKHRPIYYQYSLSRRPVESHSRYGYFEEEKSLLPLPELNL